MISPRSLALNDAQMAHQLGCITNFLPSFLTFVFIENVCISVNDSVLSLWIVSLTLPYFADNHNRIPVLLTVTVHLLLGQY